VLSQSKGAQFLQPLGKTEPWPYGVKFIDPMSLTYANVNLVPRLSQLSSRSNIDTSVQFGPFKLKIPILAAPMDTISGELMVRELFRLGALGVVPRPTNDQPKLTLELCQKLSRDGVEAIYAVGLKNGLSLSRQLKKIGAKMILLDIAHGGILKAVQTAVAIQKIGLSVLMGNIASYEQAQYYRKVGLKIARVGIGPGGLCTTRLVAGTGIGQLSAIFDIQRTGIEIVADGGIKYAGDVAKAIAAGAKVVMIGSLFAGTDEAPGEIIGNTKVARGQASLSYMNDRHIKTGEFRAAEGVQTTVARKGPVKHVINNLVGGLRSAMSYAGAANLSEFQQKAQFVLASEAVRRENQPHINQS